MIKECKKCKDIKYLDMFPKSSRYIDGHRNVCKECTYRRDSNSSKKYYEKNKANIHLKRKEYRELNRDKIASYEKEWRQKNKKIIARKRRERLKKDPFFKCTSTLRRRLNRSIKSKNWSHKSSFNKYIGCTKDEFISHIESLFQFGMSWDNHGVHGWHLDHKIPLSSAKSQDEIYALCHFSNIQPLWSVDNLKKGNKS